MKKKYYLMPTMYIVTLHHQNQILVGSNPSNNANGENYNEQEERNW